MTNSFRFMRDYVKCLLEFECIVGLQCVPFRVYIDFSVAPTLCI